MIKGGFRILGHAINQFSVPLPEPAERKLDYLSFTLPDWEDPVKAFEKLGLNFTELGYALNRYKRSAKADSGDVRVMWDGNEIGMGVHVQLSGGACRLVESLEGFTDWRSWMSSWLDEGARFSRVDLTGDDVAGTIPFHVVRDQVETGVAVRRSQSHEYREKTVRGTKYQSLTLGSRKSETYVRIYDKGMEQNEARSWLRFEFEFKGERADAMARMLVNEGWDAAFGVILSIIAFKDVTHHTSDRSRQRNAPWWEAFVNASKHVLRIEREAHKCLIKAHAWLKKQAAPIIGTLAEYEGGGIDWFVEIIKEGQSRMTARHRMMLQGMGSLPGLEGAL